MTPHKEAAVEARIDSLVVEGGTMSQLTVALPTSVTEGEARLLLAIKLFEVGRLSCGQAAEMAGYSKRTFMELLGKHGVAAFDYDAADLTDDLKHA
jgi:predicted HTH domain antitoxin